MSSGQYRVLQVSNISPLQTKTKYMLCFRTLVGSRSSKLSFTMFIRQNPLHRLRLNLPPSNFIPDEETALQSGGPLLPGQRQLPPNVINQEQDIGDGQKWCLLTIDPNLSALGLPPYPALPAETEPSKVEEIRRTVYVGNLDKNCDGDELMEFFNTNIERMTTGSDSLPCAYAYVEFTNQSSVALALQNNGIEYKGRCLRIQHSRVAIIKPQRKTADQALAEVEEAIKTNEGKDKSSDGIFHIFKPEDFRLSILAIVHQEGGDPFAAQKISSPRYSKSPSTRRSGRRSRSRSSRGRDKRSKSKDRKSKRSRSRDKDRKSSKKRSSRDREKARDKEAERDSRHSRSVKDKDKDKERESKSSKKERKRSRSKTPKKERKDKEKFLNITFFPGSRPQEKFPKRKKDKNGSSDTSPVTKTAKPMAQEMEFEEETLRERLLEELNKKATEAKKRMAAGCRVYQAGEAVHSCYLQLP
uniref:RRM domain-containing protein n=1 Tax=Ditylenchus dipsaci TaxID=166011 RepID=A0A915EFP5_9BILA